MVSCLPIFETLYFFPHSADQPLRQERPLTLLPPLWRGKVAGHVKSLAARETAPPRKHLDSPSHRHRDVIKVSRANRFTACQRHRWSDCALFLTRQFSLLLETPVVTAHFSFCLTSCASGPGRAKQAEAETVDQIFDGFHVYLLLGFSIYHLATSNLTPPR